MTRPIQFIVFLSLFLVMGNAFGQSSNSECVAEDKAALKYAPPLDIRIKRPEGIEGLTFTFPVSYLHKPLTEAYMSGVTEQQTNFKETLEPTRVGDFYFASSKAGRESDATLFIRYGECFTVARPTRKPGPDDEQLDTNKALLAPHIQNP